MKLLWLCDFLSGDPLNSQVFWFGDLNYRINMSDSEVRKLVAKKQWHELLNSDQVRLERIWCVKKIQVERID